MSRHPGKRLCRSSGRLPAPRREPRGKQDRRRPGRHETGHRLAAGCHGSPRVAAWPAGSDPGSGQPAPSARHRRRRAGAAPAEGGLGSRHGHPGCRAAGHGGSAVSLDGASAGLTAVGLLAIAALTRGACSVSDKDVLGKTVSRSTRGTATGAAALLALAFGSALSSGLLPPDVSVIAAVLAFAGVLMLSASALVLRLDEAPGATEGGANALDRAREPWSQLRSDRQLQRFIVTRGPLTATALSPPVSARCRGRRRVIGQRHARAPCHRLGPRLDPQRLRVGPPLGPFEPVCPDPRGIDRQRRAGLRPGRGAEGHRLKATKKEAAGASCATRHPRTPVRHPGGRGYL